MKIFFPLAFLCLFLSSNLFAQEKRVYELTSSELTKKPQPSPEFSQWLEENNEKLGQKAPQSSKIGTRVTLAFTVTEEGRIENVGVWRGIGQGYDEYAYNLIKNNPHTWQTGEIQSGKVSTEVYYELDFIKNKNRVVTKESTSFSN